jgi:hypothetical protein
MVGNIWLRMARNACSEPFERVLRICIIRHNAPHHDTGKGVAMRCTVAQAKGRGNDHLVVVFSEDTARKKKAQAEGKEELSAATERPRAMSRGNA